MAKKIAKKHHATKASKPAPIKKIPAVKPAKALAKRPPVVRPANGKPAPAKLSANKSPAMKTPVLKSAAVKGATGKLTQVKAPPKPVGKTKVVVDTGPKIGSQVGSMSRMALGAPLGSRLPITPQVIPTPVPTDGKPRKNLAGITPRELENFRELLLHKRRELVGDMSSMEREALRSTSGTNLSNLPMHMADMGTDNYEQEFTLGLVEKERQLLREINVALAKIQDGRYGICEGTGKPINRPRLEAQPWAKYSIEYARLLERNMMRR